GAIAAAVLGVGIYFAARPIGGAIKGWQSRRSAREAFTFIEQGKWSDANAKARDALFLRSTEPESWRAIGRLASRTNQWASALVWWKRVDDATRLKVRDRRDFVNAGVMSGERALGAKQVEALLAQPGGPMPIDIVWAGQVAKRQSNPELALDYAQRVLADKRAKPYDVLSAATLILSLTRPDSQPYADAWQQIENAARDPKNPGSLESLVLLANEKAVPPMSPSNPAFSLDSTPPPERTAPPAPTQEAASSAVAGGDDAGSTKAAPTKDENSVAKLSVGSTPQPPTRSGDSITLDLAAGSPPTPAGQTMSLTEVAN